jgi:hypothetical protein
MFLEEVQKYRASFDHFIPEVMEIDDKIRQAKERFILECIDHESG